MLGPSTNGWGTCKGLRKESCRDLSHLLIKKGMSCWWNHLFHLFRGKPNATSIRIIRGPGLDHIPPPPPSSMAPAKAKWPALRCSSESEVGGGAFPGKTWWGCHWIQKQKNIVGNSTWSQLWLFPESSCGLCRDWKLQTGHVAAKHGKSLEQKHRTINQSRVKNLCSHKPHLSPLASLSKLIIKQIGGVLEVSSSMQTFPWWPRLMVTSNAIIFHAESSQARKSNILAIDIKLLPATF